MDKQDKTADGYYKCCKCGKTLSLHSGITCTQPMAVRTSGICGGSTTQEITKEEYFETLYNWSEHRTAELEAKIKELENERDYHAGNSFKNLKAVRELQTKILALEEQLKAADEVINSNDDYAANNTWVTNYEKALEKYQSLKK